MNAEDPWRLMFAIFPRETLDCGWCVGVMFWREVHSMVGSFTQYRKTIP